MRSSLSEHSDKIDFLFCKILSSSMVGVAEVLIQNEDRAFWKTSVPYLEIFMQPYYKYRVVCTRSARKVSSHFEYLDNRSRGLDVTWQPVRGDLTAHPWTVTLRWVQSVGSETPLTEIVHCVTVAFTNLLNFNWDFSFGKSQKSQGDKSGL